MKKSAKKIILTFLLTVMFVLPAFTEAWYLCLGSYRQESNAQALINSLKEENIGAIIDNYEKDSVPYFRVFLEEYYPTIDIARDKITEIEALPIMKKLKVSGIWVCFGSEKLQEEVKIAESKKAATVEVAKSATEVSVANSSAVVSAPNTPTVSKSEITVIKDETPIEQQATAKEKNLKIKPEQLPPSGAKIFLSNQFGVINFFKSINEEYDSDYVIEDIIDAIDPEEITDYIGEALEDSDYGQKLGELIDKLEEDFEALEDSFDENGTISYTLNEKPGKATDLPEDIQLDIPQIKLIVDGSIDDPDEPTKGSFAGSAALDFNVKAMDLNMELNNLQADASLYFIRNRETERITGKGTLSEDFSFNLEKTGFKLIISNCNNSIEATASFDDESFMAEGKLSSNMSAFVEIDTEKLNLDSEDTPLKYLISSIDIYGNLSGNPEMDSEENFTGEINCDYTLSVAAGMTFNPINNIGTKMIIQGDIKLKGNLDLEHFIENITDFIERMDETDFEEKLSEEELSAFSLPLDVMFAISFYNDSNTETLSFLNITSLYDLYSYLFDIYALFK